MMKAYHVDGVCRTRGERVDGNGAALAVAVISTLVLAAAFVLGRILKVI